MKKPSPNFYVFALTFALLLQPILVLADTGKDSGVASFHLEIEALLNLEEDK